MLFIPVLHNSAFRQCDVFTKELPAGCLAGSHCDGRNQDSVLQSTVEYPHPGYGIKIFLNSVFTFFSLAFLPV